MVAASVTRAGARFPIRWRSVSLPLRVGGGVAVVTAESAAVRKPIESFILHAPGFDLEKNEL